MTIFGMLGNALLPYGPAGIAIFTLMCATGTLWVQFRKLRTKHVKDLEEYHRRELELLERQHKTDLKTIKDYQKLIEKQTEAITKVNHCLEGIAENLKRLKGS